MFDYILNTIVFGCSCAEKFYYNWDLILKLLAKYKRPDAVPINISKVIILPKKCNSKFTMYVWLYFRVIYFYSLPCSVLRSFWRISIIRSFSQACFSKTTTLKAVEMLEL